MYNDSRAKQTVNYELKRVRNILENTLNICRVVLVFHYSCFIIQYSWLFNIAYKSGITIQMCIGWRPFFNCNLSQITLQIVTWDFVQYKRTDWQMALGSIAAILVNECDPWKNICITYCMLSLRLIYLRGLESLLSNSCWLKIICFIIYLITDHRIISNTQETLRVCYGSIYGIKLDLSKMHCLYSSSPKIYTWFSHCNACCGLIYVYFTRIHYNDVIIGVIASQITSLTIVYSIVYSDADQRKHRSSASLVFVWGIQRGRVNSPHKWPVTCRIFPFDDVIMLSGLVP